MIKHKCRACKRKKSISFFSTAEWNRLVGNGTCRECLRPKRRTGGGKEIWRKQNAQFFMPKA